MKKLMMYMMVLGSVALFVTGCGAKEETATAPAVPAVEEAAPAAEHPAADAPKEHPAN